MINRMATWLLVPAILLSLEVEAHVELTYPEGGDTFYANDTVTITWFQEQAHETLNWELYFSPDGGDNWEVISNNIGVPEREYDWIVPAVETTKGRIRVVQNNQEEDYNDVSSNFTILLPQDIHEFQPVLINFSLFPNPANERISCSFTLSDRENLTITILDAQGKEHQRIADASFAPGEHTIAVPTAHLADGIYYAVVRFRDLTRSKQFLIRHP